MKNEQAIATSTTSYRPESSIFKLDHKDFFQISLNLNKDNIVKKKKNTHLTISYEEYSLSLVSSNTV